MQKCTDFAHLTGVLRGLRCNLCDDIVNRDSTFLPGVAGAAVWYQRLPTFLMCDQKLPCKGLH